MNEIGKARALLDKVEHDFESREAYIPTKAL